VSRNSRKEPRRPRTLPEQGSLDEDRVHPQKRERRDCARLEAGRVLYLFGAGDAGERAIGRAGDLLGIGAPVSGNKHEHGAAAALEEERLDDLAELATNRPGGVLRGRRSFRELLDPDLGAGLAQVCGDALNRLWPGSRRHAQRVPAQPKSLRANVGVTRS
jgi:hypothetical protein